MPTWVWRGMVLLGMSTMACGGASQNYEASRPAAVFPTRAELSAIPEKKVTEQAFDLDNVQVESWTYDGAPSALADGPYEDNSPWAPVLADLVRTAPPGRLRLSTPLRCAAEQTARFHLKHRKLPSLSWRRFTVARCGSAAPFAGAEAWTLDLPDGVDEAQLVQSFRREAAPALLKVFSRLPHRAALGLAAVREGKRLAVGFVVAPDPVVLDAGSFRADARRRVTVRGRLMGESAEAILGWVNRGKYGVAECVSNRNVQPPLFSISCEMAEGDKWAFIDVLARPKGRALATNVATLLVPAEGESLPSDYTPPRITAQTAPVRTADEFRRVLAERLNAVRAAGGLAPLRVSAEQSRTSERLAGIMVGPTRADRDAAADRAAIGLLAGWDVRGLIRDGSLFVGAVPGARDAAAWLEFAIEHPIGRSTLLAPQSRVVAIGPALADSVEAVGAVVTTYALFEGNDHRAEADRVVAGLTEARIERGLPAPVRLVNVPHLADQLEAVRAEKKAPGAVLHETLEYMAARLASGHIQGFVFETLDVDRLELPKELFAPGPMRVAVEVTHHRAPGAAWGQYVVYIFAHLNFQGGPLYDAHAAPRDDHAVF